MRTIHGVHGFLDRTSTSPCTSLWIDIIHDTPAMCHKGVDLLGGCKKAIVNGAGT